ncbi:MAG: hypothetical protein GY757_47495 [bacterium]|nr:hypothetical protein [bacterium]
MKKFELCFNVTDREKADNVKKYSVLIPDLLEVAEPEFGFDNDNALKYYLLYDFLPKSVMARFIVKRNKEIKNNLRWRTGVVLENKAFKSTAVVKVDERDKKIHIDVSGEMKRDMFAALRHTFKEINDSFEKLTVQEMVPLTDDKTVAVPYNELLGLAKMGVHEYKSGALMKTYDINRLLDVFVSPGDRKKDSDKIIKVEGDLHLNFNQLQNLQNKLEATQNTEVKQETNVDIDIDIDINIDIKVELPALQESFEQLKELLLEQSSLPQIKEKLQTLEDSLDTLHPGCKKEQMTGPMNKLGRFLNKLGEKNSKYGDLLKGAANGIEHAQNLGKSYNNVAQWLAMPQIPELLLK